jgi:hypothetical protein
VSADDEVTITVSRRDLDDVAFYVRHNAHDRSPVSYCIRRIEAAIPAPPWEPSDEQVEAVIAAWGPPRSGYPALR